jgi:IS605 OrfB family transposase
MIQTNKQFSTVIIKLGRYQELEQTVKIFNNICQEIIDYGWEQKTWNKNKLHYGTYKNIRTKYPMFSSAMVQTARDQASEIIKRTLKSKRKLGKPIKNSLSGIRYDKRCLSVLFDKNVVSINTTFGRIKLPFVLAEYYSQYKGWKYTNAQLIRRKDKNYYLNLQMCQELPIKNKDCNIVGIDLGIKNIAVCSDNTFYNSKKLKNIKGKYQKLKRDLQSIGTKSAKRKLQRISRKENRFVRDVNHCISKKIVNANYTVFALENLKNIRYNVRTYNKKLNRMIGNWSFAMLQGFVQYKAERLGKSIVFVRPYYTSQQCSKCGCIKKENRVGNVFKCKDCRFELNADLNASRNIARIGRTDFLQGAVNHPNVGVDEGEVRKEMSPRLSISPVLNSAELGRGC